MFFTSVRSEVLRVYACCGEEVLRLYSAEAERVCESRLLNKLVKDNV